MIIHKCDLCNKETENVIIIQVPINKYIYAMNKGIKLAKFKLTGISLELPDI